MSNIDLIIEERPADIGDFLVGRLLPFRSRRTVGPFAFIDHMGPSKMKANEMLSVPAHPHIGLATLTYLFEGCIVHRDSLGTEVEINPGAVNWMTAGKGIAHSERSPERLRGQEKTLHGMQIWVALPKEKEDISPSFNHTPANALPQWKSDGVNYKLIAGSAFGKSSPVPVHSPLYFVELKTDKKASITIGNAIYGESAIYILSGKIKVGEHTFGEKQLLVAKESSLCNFEMESNTTVYVFGGEAFQEKRYIDWNFVSSDLNKIHKARDRWKAGKFDEVPNESEFVPYPDK